MFNSESTSTDDQRSLSESTHDLPTDPSDHRQNEDVLGENSHGKSNPIQDGKVPKPDDERKLFVGQLSPDITKEDLQKYFSQFGNIEDVTIKYDVPGGRARGFAFILFDQKETIEKVLRVPTHFINQCQIDPKQAHRRPPVTNPVKKIFLGQLPIDFVEEDLVNYFSQFGLIDAVELPTDRGKGLRRPFGFVSFSCEKTAEEVLRQQRHSINGASIEVRPAKPRPHEQQQNYQMAQSIPYGEYLLSPQSNPLTASSTVQHTSMVHHPNSFHPSIVYQQNYSGQMIDQWSQTGTPNTAFWNGNNPSQHGNSQWSNGTNPGLTSVNVNANVYSTLGNSSTSSSVYRRSSAYNPNGVHQQASYPIQGSYSIPTGYTISPNQFSTCSPAPSASWNQFHPILNGGATATVTNHYDPNVYYMSSDYQNVHPHQYYSVTQQQQYGMNSSQGNISVDGTASANGLGTSSSSSANVVADKSYHHPTR